MLITMIVMIIICYLVVMKRIDLVYKIRIKAINQLWDRKKYGEWRKIENNPSYTRMLFMLTKWKFEDFYPDLEKEE